MSRIARLILVVGLLDVTALLVLLFPQDGRPEPAKLILVENRQGVSESGTGKSAQDKAQKMGDQPKEQTLRRRAQEAPTLEGLPRLYPFNERDPLKPRVPPDQLDEARALKNPVPVNDKSLAKGKALYESRGTCYNCHGKAGDGKGLGGATLDPSPRNFTNCKFHKKRKDGELFWVIKNGSAGTGMVSLVPGTISEEEAWVIINYERSFCKQKTDDE